MYQLRIAAVELAIALAARAMAADTTAKLGADGVVIIDKEENDFVHPNAHKIKEIVAKHEAEVTANGTPITVKMIIMMIPGKGLYLAKDVAITQKEAEGQFHVKSISTYLFDK